MNTYQVITFLTTWLRKKSHYKIRQKKTWFIVKHGSDIMITEFRAKNINYMLFPTE